MVNSQKHHELLQFGIFIMTAVLLFVLVKPVIVAFFTSVILAYIFFPVYERIYQKIKWQNISALLTVIIIILIILVPTSLFAFQVVQQVSDMTSSLQGNIAQGTLFGFTCKQENSQFCSTVNKLDAFFVSHLSKLGLDKYIKEGSETIIEVSALYLIKIPQAIFNTVLVLFITFYLLKDGRVIHDALVDWLPFKRKTSEKLVRQFDKTTYSVVFSQLVVALVQGILGIIGFYLFGISSPVFWGVVLAFFALVPVLGATAVWLPASVLMMITSYISGNFTGILLGAGLFFYGLLVISTVDNFLRFKIIGDAAKVHPLIVLAGLVGGVTLFGVMGVFIGPILLSLIFTYFETYREVELDKR